MDLRSLSDQDCGSQRVFADSMIGLIHCLLSQKIGICLTIMTIAIKIPNVHNFTHDLLSVKKEAFILKS